MKTAKSKRHEDEGRGEEIRLFPGKPAVPLMPPAAETPVAAQLIFSRIKSEQASLRPEFLRSLAQHFGVVTFVETKTFLGDTAAMAAEFISEVHTIELTPELAHKAAERFAAQPQVHVHAGDPAKLLPEILASSSGPSLLWLDGHYSEGETARSDSKTPILTELRALQQSGRKDAIILIDDLHLFEKPSGAVEKNSSLHGYPSINQLHEAVLAIAPDYQFLILGDVALAFPDTGSLTLSPVVMGLTMSRLFDGKNLSLDEIFDAENIISQAQGEEREAIQCLPRQHAAVERYGLGLHYRLWHALTLFGESKFTAAAEEFTAVVALGFRHWRAQWYRAMALVAAEQFAPAQEILKELLKRQPNFSPAKLLCEKIAATPQKLPPMLAPDASALPALQAAGLWKPGQLLRLHLGCGEQHFDGYVNLDYPPAEHTCQTKIGADIFADITKLQFPSQSVDEIRLHHVFEHFKRAEALGLLIIWHEMLKVGGRLHLETPDLEGCAHQLISEIPLQVKQVIIRHCFGSQEAGWANHYDGWTAERYEHVLVKFGFRVQTKNWSWPHPPHLANVEAIGTKTQNLSRAELLAVADQILSEYMTMDVPSERGMCEVWRKAMRDFLEGIKPAPTGEVLVKLQGGLGNQMFQFAAGLALARSCHSRLKLDLSFLRDRTPRPNFTQRDYCLDLFQLPTDCEVVPDCSADAKRLLHHVEQQFHFDPKFFNLGSNIYLDGYFQSPRFFEPVRDEVVRTFRSFAAPLSVEQRALAEQIAACPAVCLNVRRGDFVANPVTNEFHGVCDQDYFHRAVAEVQRRVPDAHFFVFSDDIEWCRTANLTNGAPFTLVPHDFAGDRFGAYLQLMMACRHFILPNSSFGWWAAFLSSTPDKVVVVPTPWFDNAVNNTMDLLPATWIQLPKNRNAGPLVSVVICCHNYAHYLPEAVASVWRQTFRDLEIILVDDGSTDDSATVAQRLAAEAPADIAFRIIRLDDVGPAAARRFGVAQALGKYYLPLDADDRIAPDFLAKTVPLLEADAKLGFVYVDTVFFGDKQERHHQPEYDFARLCQGNFISHTSLIRKAAFDDVGGYDSENWGYYEDWDLWIRLGEKGWFGKHLGEPLFFYRHHFDSSLSLFARRLDPIYKAFLKSRHPEFYSEAVLTSARQTLAEMPAGWHRLPPMKGVATMERLRAQFPQNRHVLYFLGLAHLKNNQASRAMEIFETMLKQYPQDQDACAALASLQVPAKSFTTPATPRMKFPESKLAHQYLDGLTGLEIGGSAHNPFGLITRNVDYTADLTTVHKLEEIKMCSEALAVDIVAPGDALPVADASQDFVISSHVIEHFFDPIKAIKEWLRVIRPGGYVFIIAPHKERTFDLERPRTPLAELLDRHSGKILPPAVDTHHHYTVWTTEDLLELCRHCGWNVVEFHDADDKVGNGFTVVIQKAPKPVESALKVNSVDGAATRTPLVSVIVPTYNRPDQLVESLRSILNQTFKDFEIIVVNDAGCSVDAGIAPLNSQQQIISLRHQTNRGLAAARNTGIQAARGRYIAYLDDDDFFYPDHLQTLVDFLQTRPGTVAYTDANRAHQKLVNGQWQVCERDPAYGKDWDNDQILVDNFVPVLCFMHEKSLLEKSGLFDETLKRHEDWDMWIRLSRHFPFVRIPKTTCEFTWRDNGSSMTGQSYERFLETMRRIHAKYEAFTGGRFDLQEAQRAKREELQAMASSQQRTPKFKIGFLSMDPKVTACAYLRLTAPLDHLHTRREIEHLDVCDLVADQLKIDELLLRQAQVVVVQRGLAAVIPYDVLRGALPNPAVKIVFELDDALTLLPRGHQAYQHFQSIRPHLEAYLKNADLVTVSTPKLKEIYSHFNDHIEVLPNMVDTAVWLPAAPKPPHSGKLTILFSGTVTHEHDLALLERAIERILREFPERVEFLFWGNAPAKLRKWPQIKTVSAFMPNYKDYASHLKSLNVDLALVPLEVVPFNQAKSAIKWLEYSACKIPAIFTDIEAYNQVVDHGKTGWLVPNTAEAWYEAMKTLILDDALRRSIAENAHQTILARHTLKQNVHLWTQAYERVLALPPKTALNQTAQVSIIIPTFNNLGLTRQCLESILANTPQGLYEIIVVDNGSTDGTPAFLKQEEASGHIRAVFMPQNRGFAHGCNQGALAAKCPRLLFLNNDTVATSHWLTALLAAAEEPAVGIVGAKLLYADNTIQHAGIGWINGVPDHPHRHADALAPEVNTRRELDMVTGACFMVPRALFLQLAGFDEIYRNGVEDIDLCLRVRAAGWKVVYEPKATVYHLEGQSAGRFNHVKENLQVFFTRWGKSFDKNTNFIVPNPVKLFRANRSLLLENSKLTSVQWVGSFLDAGSLSHVNRELTNALAASGKIKVHRVNTGTEVSPPFKHLATELAKATVTDAAITVRHAWPPNWMRPKSGKLVVVQPWEFGSLPEQWVKGLANVDEAWVPSEYVRRVYVDSGVPANKVFVVPNGVDTKKFHPQVVPMKLPTTKKFKFLFVGGTIFRKGPDVLLKAYLEAFTAADDVCLVIKDFGGKTVYAGQTFEEKIRAVQALPNAPQILYLNDELAPEELPSLYRACDCLVLPYRGEGYGLPVVEAMACGLPVMVTAGGATDDFVRDEFGYRIPSQRQVFGNEISGMKLVKPGWLLEPDSAVLAGRMKWVATHPDEARERGRLASEHAKQFCSWETAREIVLKRIAEIELKRTEVRAPAAAPLRRDEPRRNSPIVLPPCALAGHLAEARDLIRYKKFRVAWESTLAAIAKRPFHPEAFLLLAEIALAVNDGEDAKLCADYARHIAPGFKNAKKFLNQRLRGNNRPEWLKLPAQVQGPSSFAKATEDKKSRLSVCLIVKNEEKFLAQCLKSVRELAQQIVVVDTGSTDRTVEIAKEFGAEVHSFTWCDDFSAARNAALEHVTGDWVLALDADEELSSKDHAQLHKAMSDATAMAWRLPIVDVGRELDGCSFVPRLFRNAPGLFYVGRVHEQIFTSIEVRRAEWGLENKIGEATLIHHGYTQELVRDRNKIERNLQLLEKAVTELPGEAHLLMHLGLELSRSGREAEAFVRYQEAFEALSSKPAAEVVPELRETLLAQYCTRLTAAKRLDEIIRVLTSPLARAGTGLTASLHFSLGLAHLELKQFSEAAAQMRQCLAKRGQRSLSPINRDILTAAPHHCLAVSLAHLGQSDDAEKVFQTGLKEIDHVAGLRLDYARFLFEQKRAVDALQQLNELVTHDTHNTMAWRLGGQIALSSAEFLEFARDWTGEAMNHVPDDEIVMAQRAEVLTLNEDTAGARMLWEKVWNKTRKPQTLAALILCETAEGVTTHKPENNQDELAASRAFIEWYQKLFAAHAQKTLTRIMEQMNAISSVLPSGAKILAAAMAEANKETVGV